MSADDLLRSVTYVLLVLIFLDVLRRTLRHPYRAGIDMTLLFGDLALLVVEREIVIVFPQRATPALGLLDSFLTLALPYLLLRLGDDFVGIPDFALRAALVSSIILLAGIIFVAPLRLPIQLLAVAFFVTVCAYASVTFLRAMRQSHGVTRRRLFAIALGTICLGLTVASLLLPVFSVSLAGPAAVFGRLFTVAVGICYFFGFATPPILRRAWQSAELRSVLRELPRLARYPDQAALLAAVSRDAALTLGASQATIALWDPNDNLLRAVIDGDVITIPPEQGVIGQAFSTQRGAFSSDLMRDNPSVQGTYIRYSARAAIAVPITSGRHRFGALAAYAKRSPIFTIDDIEIAQLLADQIAVVLENHRLVDEVARLRGREETLRLKDDFISSAAHELKTPLTIIIGQTQLLERRFRQDPQAPMRIDHVQNVTRAAKDLDEIVREMLTASNPVDQFPHPRTFLVDLAKIVRDVCANSPSPRHHFVVDAPESLTGSFVPEEIQQLVETLVENGILYSPNGGEIRVTLRGTNGRAQLTVTDQGIGIPSTDVPYLFDRFHRGSNVAAQQFPGFGLGLYVARTIVDQYDGRIWVTSDGEGKGASFHVELPLDNASAQSIQAS